MHQIIAIRVFKPRNISLQLTKVIIAVLKEPQYDATTTYSYSYQSELNYTDPVNPAADKRFIDLAAKEILLIDRQGNTIIELAVSYLMESGEVQRHIRKTRKHDQSRRDFSIHEFYRLFGDDVAIEKPAGGMALWVDLQKITHEINAERFNHPDFHFNKLFNTEQKDFTHIRFGFSVLDKKEITIISGHLVYFCMDSAASIHATAAGE